MTPQDQLEQFVDKAGLRNVLSLLSVICDQKAEHCAVNWQDSYTAKEWAKCANALDSAIVKIWGRL